MIHRRLATLIALGTVMVACVKGDGDRYYALGDGLPTLMFGGETADAAETQFREWLAYVHMDSTDADCLVARVKTSPQWQDKAASFSVPADEANRFARDCGIELAELYTVSHGD